MRILRLIADRWRALVGRERVTGEIADELAHHEALLAETLERGGLSPDAARAEARRRVGNRALLQDRGYDVRGGGAAEALLQDLRYGLRGLRKQPLYTLVAVATLALGIGANTAIFSVASGVLLRPLPYANGDRLSMVWMDNRRIDLARDWHSYPAYEDYRTGNTTFEDMAAFNRRSWTITGQGEPTRIRGAHATASLFPVLGATAEIGRVFTREEDEGGAAVMVLSHGLWQRMFGGRPDVIGRTVTLSARPTEVIGVMPAGFAFPTPDTDLWVPTSVAPGARTNRGAIWLQVIGLRKPGVGVAQAQADLERVNRAILEANPNQQGYGVFVTSYYDEVVGPVRPAILALLGAVGLVLLIACTNVANLAMTRAATRDREFALRAAIGAGRGRLVRQLLTESVLLAVAGGVTGLALGAAGLQLLVAVAPPDLPRLAAIGIDGRVFAFTALLALATGLVFGVAPAWQTARTDPGAALKEGGRGASAGGRGFRRALVVAEVALAVMLLVGAGLMVRSLVRMQQVDLGLDTTGVLSARVALLGDRYQDEAPRVDFFARFVDRARAVPGVEAAAAVGSVFLSATPNSTNFAIEGRPDFAPDEAIEVPVDSLTPGYFDLMRVPLREGRAFDTRDTATSEPVAIVNASMARRFWPEGALGRRFKFGRLASGTPWMTIVGVAADTRRTGYEAAVRPEVYLPQSQGAEYSMQVLLRTTGDPAAMAPALRSLVRDLDPSVALQDLRPLDEERDAMLAQRRLNTRLFALFAVVAAALAAIGIYGVIAHGVAQRTRELGVRVALGATGRSLLGLVLREALGLVGIGLVLGLGGALAAGGAMRRLLYEVEPADPATLVAIALLTLAVAALAVAAPAIRALRVDPLHALRDG
ncbi:MAG: ABC transporter permease [Vicinamibacterales bacterium]